LEKIQTGLLKNGMNEKTPVAVISQATTPKQITVVSVLKDLMQVMEKNPVPTPALVVVGKVVNLRENLSFFEKKPLFSKNIIVTRAKEKISELSNLLYDAGANVIEFPMIKIEKILDIEMFKAVLTSFAKFEYVIFTSESGVRIFFEELFALSYDARIFSGKRICAIGQKTREALLRCGLNANIVPERETSEGLWEKLVYEIKNENNVFLVQAKNGRKYLSEMLEKACSLTRIFPYETKMEETDKEKLNELINNTQIDAITFTSPSSVENFFSHFSAKKLRENNVLLFSIGEITTKAIKNLGLTVKAESEKADVHSLFLAVQNVLCNRSIK